MQLFTSPESESKVPSRLLTDRYIVSPFSILNTICQNWQKRKDRWEDIGFRSELGRDTKRYNATPSNTFSARGISAKEPNSISTFDPVLCEIMYKWFSREGDTILDPFAGGVVRGAVASILGRDYYGIDLSESQIRENEAQYAQIIEKYDKVSGSASWRVGDASEVLYNNTIKANMIFMCPPYYNLERYSTDPRDLSNMTSYEEFIAVYRTIVDLACTHLDQDSFAVAVVSEVRAKTGEFYGFVPDTVRAFTDAGMQYYNEIILENNIGSLPIRAPKYFNDSRKIGRQHQNILVFYKGNTKNIHEKFGDFFDKKF